MQNLRVLSTVATSGNPCETASPCALTYDEPKLTVDLSSLDSHLSLEYFVDFKYFEYFSGNWIEVDSDILVLTFANEDVQITGNVYSKFIHDLTLFL